MLFIELPGLRSGTKGSCLVIQHSSLIFPEDKIHSFILTKSEKAYFPIAVIVYFSAVTNVCLDLPSMFSSSKNL